MSTIATGQVWRSKRDPQRRIRLLNPDDALGGDPEGWDWRYETIPSPIERRRTGWIFGCNIARLYILEEESPLT